jgi:hypothetical protein
VFGNKGRKRRKNQMAEHLSVFVLWDYPVFPELVVAVFTVAPRSQYRILYFYADNRVYFAFNGRIVDKPATQKQSDG